MIDDNNDKESQEQGQTDEKPQVYAVQKDLGCWRFQRRNFLTAAVYSAVVAAGALAGCEAPSAVTGTPRLTETSTAKNIPAPTSTHAPTSTPTATATATPTLTPTKTRTPTPTATVTSSPTATPVPIPQAAFVSDVTIPDGTVMSPGQKFTKTWRIKNVGTINLGAKTDSVFESGEQMGGTSPVSVGEVTPNSTADISVGLTAPAGVGKHAGQWRLRANGSVSLIPMTVEIFVALQESIAPGKEGVTIQLEGRTMTLPCGSPIPAGWVCSCNCVTAPKACSCDRVCTCDRVCSCDGNCTCNSVGHYWHPN